MRDLELKNKQRFDEPQKFNDALLNGLLDEDPNQSTGELARQFGVGHTLIANRLHQMEKVKKHEK